MEPNTTPLLTRMHGHGWHLNPRRRVVLFILAPLAGAGLVYSGITLLFKGMPLTGIGIGGIMIGTAIALLPLIKRHVRLPVTTYVRQGTAGTLIPFRPPSIARLVVFGLLSSLFLVLDAIILIISVRDGKWGPGLLGVGLTSFLTLVFGLAFLGTIVSRRMKGRGIFVSGAGLVLVDRKRPVEISWDAIQELRPHWRRRAFKVRIPSPQDIVSNWLTFERRADARGDERDVYWMMSGTYEPTVLVDDIACDPVRVLDALNLYLTQPVARSELGTEAAVNRMSVSHS